MNEGQIREEALLSDEEIINELRPIIAYHLKPTDSFIAKLNDFREIAQAQLDKVLKDKRVRIECENQDLPVPKTSQASLWVYIQEAQQDMLTPKDNEVWVKCKVKEEQ
jgi:hypothetical protein